jgi:hypothetical protein
MPKSNFFLTPPEVAQLSGVARRGSSETLGERQSAALTKMGIVHYLNEAQRVIVVRSTLERRDGASEPKPYSRGPDWSKVK